MIRNFLRDIFFPLLVVFALLSCEQPEKGIDKNPTVYIEESKGKYQLIRNGEPFYIKGGAAAPGYLEELKAAGANTARIYDTIGLAKILDEAHKLGLAVVVDIPLPSFNIYPDYYEENFDQEIKKLRSFVQKFKDHPALLYWNLGNEIHYPLFYKRSKFFSNYNALLKTIKLADPNHPVSLSVIAGERKRIFSILLKSPGLDFISFNTFGSLARLKKTFIPIVPFWNGPFVISEWGTNGHWESKNTSWEAPIEETATKKAEQTLQRYNNFVEPLKKLNSLGSLVFYWGQKDEVTPTWFSLFSRQGLKSQTIFDLEKIWKGTTSEYPGPVLDFLLFNEQGAAENIIVVPGEEVIAKVVHPEDQEDLRYRWEIRTESWFKNNKSQTVDGIKFSKNENTVSFEAPTEEGPYRLFLYLTNGTEYFATANIPFYVLNPEDAK